MIKKYTILLFTFFHVLIAWAQDYEQDVLPIFQVNCAGCHGFDGSGFTSGLDLTDQAGILAGATSGDVVVFGDYENSPLYQEISTGSMPPSWSGNSDLTIDEINIIVNWIQSLVDGCTDPSALNYNPEAVNDDGSCEYGPWEVVSTDANMTIQIGVDVVTIDGDSPPLGSFIGAFFINDDNEYVCGGYTEWTGEQLALAVWGSEAGQDNGFEAGEVITWVLAIEGEDFFEISSSMNSQSVFSETFVANGFGQLLSAVFQSEQIDSCDDLLACNYGEVEADCVVPDLNLCEICDDFGGIIVQDADGDGVCDDNEVLGCTDEAACANYDPLATDDDGSCLYFDTCGVCGGDDALCVGCMDENACNYDANATIEGDCDFVSCVGCLDPSACNYDSDAFIDGECIYPSEGINCDGVAFGCGDSIDLLNGPFSFNGNSYYISGNVYSWDAASALAENYGTDVFYLATINSQEEQNFIASIIDGSENLYWIGLYQNTSNVNYSEPDGGWEWVTGEPLNFAFWNINQPDNDGGESFAELLYYESFDSPGVWTWNDSGSDAENLFIMECGPLFFTEGCTDDGDQAWSPFPGVSACNYNPNATDDDGSCVYLDGVCETCENGIIIDNDEDDDEVCDDDEIFGCTDLSACNYDDAATEDDGSCFFPNSDCDYCSGATDGTGFVIDNDADNDGICDDDEIVGCTDEAACANYDPLATDDDGSCLYEDECGVCGGPGAIYDCGCDVADGCTNPNACNYDPNALCDDGSCESLSCVGCLDPDACNYCDDCTVEPSNICNYDTCCNIEGYTNYDSNCTCPDIDACFDISDGCFPCDGVTITPIPYILTYGAYNVSCYGASDGYIEFNFNTMNLASSGSEPYSIDVYYNDDINGDGLISIDEEIFIGTATEGNDTFENLTAGTYVFQAYDSNGCCFTLQTTLDEPGENTLLLADYEPIACPDGETELNFTVEGSVGQFDVFIDGNLYEESVEGGTLTVSSNDFDSDGIPDDFVQLNTSFYFNENFWPEEYEDIMNECDGTVNTIYVNIENNNNIDDGDLIGAFYTTGEGGLQSFGYNEYVSSSSGSSLLTIQVCEGDDNGFNNGEEVIFLVYDVSEDLIYEVNVVYESNPDGISGVFSDVFTSDPTYSGIWISSLTIVGVSGTVPDFSLTVTEGSYAIEILRTDSYDSNGDGVLDEVYECLVVDTIINVIDPDPMSVDVVVGGAVCNYLDDNNNIQSTPEGYIELNNFIGGTPPYTYTWFDPSGNVIEQSFVSGVMTLEDFENNGVLDDLDFLNTGIYTLNVLDANLCPFDTVIEIEGSDVQLGEIEFNYNLIACTGGTTDINIAFATTSNDYVFTWLNSSGNELVSDSFSGSIDIDDVSEGTYTAIITDPLGCSITQDLDVDINPSGQIAIFNPFIDLVCEELDAYVSFMDCDTEDGSCIANGDGPFTYSWSSVEYDLNNNPIYTDLGYPETTSSTTLAFGTYAFSVTDSNGCTGEVIFDLIAPEPIEFEPVISPIICPDFPFGSISLEIISGNPGLYDFIFEGDTTTINVGGSSDLGFSYSVTDVNATLLFNDVSIFSNDDIIGVFYTGSDGITCGGSTVYQGESVFSIAVWGDDSSTIEDDGFETGDDILILLNSGGVVYELIIVDYLVDSPFNYAPNATSAITEIVIGDEFVQGPSFTTGLIESGSYFLEVYDGNDCYWSDLVTIDPVEEFVFTSQVANPSCDGSSGEITIDVFGGTPNSIDGYTFIWTGPDGFATIDAGNSNTITDLAPGEYNLIVFDDADPLGPGDCMLDGQFILEVETSDPVISIADEICEDDATIDICVDWPGVITFSCVGGGLNLSNDSEDGCYSFTDLYGGDFNIGLSGVSYTISAYNDNNTCSYETTVFINASSDVVFDLEIEDADCEDGAGSVEMIGLGGGDPPYDIDWQGINTFEAPATPPGAVYEVIVTDASGCVYIEEYVIGNGTEINPSIESVPNICYGGTDGSLSFDITGGGSGSNYDWVLYGPNSLIDIVLEGSTSTETLNNLASGVYTLYIEDFDAGCELYTTHEITSDNTEIIFDVIDPTSVDLWDIDLVLEVPCYDDTESVVMNIEGQDNSDFYYYWYALADIDSDGDIDGDNELNSSDSVLDLGELIIEDALGVDEIVLSPSYYCVFVRNEDGCFSDTVLFKVDSPNPFEISVDDIMLECYGDNTSVSATVTGGSDGDIDGDGIQNEIDLDIDGDGILDSDGDCISNCNDDDPDIDNDNIPNIGFDGIPGNADDDDYIGGNIYNGLSTSPHPDFENGLVFVDINNPSVEVDEYNLSAGTYMVYSYDTNGCMSNEELFVISEPDPLGLSMFYDYNAIGVDVEILPNTPIEILCSGDSIAINIAPFGGTIIGGEDIVYNILCIDGDGVEYNLEEEMLSTGVYNIFVSDDMGCEINDVFIISESPNQLTMNANGVMQYNDFHISCNGESDGVIEFSVPQFAGVSPYSVDIFDSNGILISGYENILPENTGFFDSLSADTYTLTVTDFNECMFDITVELIEPEIFNVSELYTINASCDEESDGMFIIRTSGANPPLYYTVNNLPEVYSTMDTLLVVYENNYNLGTISDEIELTESDILVQGLDVNLGNNPHSVQILYDSQSSCLESETIYFSIGSDDRNCLFIPSVFTPNGDGINDTWQIDGIGLYPDASIKVFNRWGQLIYESEGSYTPWDGVGLVKISDQEIATYYYIINLNINDKDYTGSVTIKR